MVKHMKNFAQVFHDTSERSAFFFFLAISFQSSREPSSRKSSLDSVQAMGTSMLLQRVNSDSTIIGSPPNREDRN